MTEISIVIPVLNGEATIGRALASLGEQSFPDFEALIVDDGSTDGTGAVVRALAEKDGRFRYIALDRNGGVAAARNRAFGLARGQWITLLDADDWYEPERLEKLLQMARELDADAVFDNLRVFDHVSGILTEETRFQKGSVPELLKPIALFERDTPFSKYAIGYAQPMVKASFLREKNIRYDERLRLGEDFAFLAEMVLQGGRVFALPFAAYVYRHRVSPSSGAVSPFSRSANDHKHIKEACRELKRKYEDGLSLATLRAMKKRCRAFGRLVQAQRFRDAWRARDASRGIQLLLEDPWLAFFILKIVFLRWARRRG